MRIADVFACVRALSDSASSLPLIAYRRSGDGGRERFGGRLDSLLTTPSPGATTANLIGTLVAHLNLHGNAYLGKYRDERGVVSQLAPISPATVTVSVEGGEPVYTLLRGDGVSRYGRDDVIHIRALSTDGLVGLSPIAQARQALGLAQSLAGHADNFARNAGRPGGILAVKGYAQPPQDGATDPYDDIKDRFQGRFTAENAGKVMVIAGDQLEYQQLALSLVDAQHVEQRQLSTAEIARVFRVPPWMIGAPSGDSMTYSNVESQASAFVKFALAPWLTLIEQALSADADLAPSTVFCEFLLDGLLRADSEARARVYAQALDPDRGWMTRAEVRRLENLPPEPQESAWPSPPAVPSPARSRTATAPPSATSSTARRRPPRRPSRAAASAASSRTGLSRAISAASVR